MNARAAEELELQAEEIKNLVSAKLTGAKLIGPQSTALPAVQVIIDATGTGGGGAEFTVELLITSSVASPFLSDRNISAIIWRAAAADKQMISYDPKLKKLVNPPGTPNQRIYSAVEQLIGALLADLQRANSRRAA